MIRTCITSHERGIRMRRTVARRAFGIISWMRKGIATFGVTFLAVAGVAVAAGGPTVTVSVKPDTPKSHSTLSVSAKGPFTESGIPTSLKLTAQKGFDSSAKSVPVLCDTSKVKSSSSKPCPAKSKIGSGEVVATVSGFGKQTIPFTMYLGARQKKGDIAAVVLSGKIPIIGTENVVGRLFKATNGSIEILFSKLPSVPVSAKLDKLSFSAHAVRGKNSLITNPPSCTGGHWTGTIKVGFSGGSFSKTTSIPCSK